MCEFQNSSENDTTVEPAQEAAQPEQGAGPNAEGDNGDAEMAEILNDLEELFGEPVFLTH